MAAERTPQGTTQDAPRPVVVDTPPRSEAAILEGPWSRTRPARSALTLNDLPPSDTVRWVARRKAVVVEGVRTGLISLDEACARYSLSVEEFHCWEKSLSKNGLKGLCARRQKRD